MELMAGVLDEEDRQLALSALYGTELPEPLSLVTTRYTPRGLHGHVGIKLRQGRRGSPDNSMEGSASGSDRPCSTSPPPFDASANGPRARQERLRQILQEKDPHSNHRLSRTRPTPVEDIRKREHPHALTRELAGERHLRDSTNDLFAGMGHAPRELDARFIPERAPAVRDESMSSIAAAATAARRQTARRQSTMSIVKSPLSMVHQTAGKSDAAVSRMLRHRVSLVDGPVRSESSPHMAPGHDNEHSMVGPSMSGIIRRAAADSVPNSARTRADQSDRSLGSTAAGGTTTRDHDESALSLSGSPLPSRRGLGHNDSAASLQSSGELAITAGALSSRQVVALEMGGSLGRSPRRAAESQRDGTGTPPSDSPNATQASLKASVHFAHGIDDGELQTSMERAPSAGDSEARVRPRRGRKVGARRGRGERRRGSEGGSSASSPSPQPGRSSRTSVQAHASETPIPSFSPLPPLERGATISESIPIRLIGAAATPHPPARGMHRARSNQSDTEEDEHDRSVASVTGQSRTSMPGAGRSTKSGGRHTHNAIAEEEGDDKWERFERKSKQVMGDFKAFLKKVGEDDLGDDINFFAPTLNVAGAAPRVNTVIKMTAKDVPREISQRMIDTDNRQRARKKHGGMFGRRSKFVRPMHLVHKTSDPPQPVSSFVELPSKGKKAKYGAWYIPVGAWTPHQDGDKPNDLLIPTKDRRAQEIAVVQDHKREELEEVVATLPSSVLFLNWLGEQQQKDPANNIIPPHIQQFAHLTRQYERDKRDKMRRSLEQQAEAAEAQPEKPGGDTDEDPGTSGTGGKSATTPRKKRGRRKNQSPRRSARGSASGRSTG